MRNGMRKLKTAELSGHALDWAVARCEGITVAIMEGKQRHLVVDEWCNPMMYHDDWSLAGEIIEREKLGMWWATHFVDGEGVECGNHWYSEAACRDDNADNPYRISTGETPLIAAMRCYVTSKLGDEVDVPVLLLKPTAEEWVEWGVNNGVSPELLERATQIEYCVDEDGGQENNPYIFNPKK